MITDIHIHLYGPRNEIDIEYLDDDRVINHAHYLSKLRGIMEVVKFVMGLKFTIVEKPNDVN